jgi:hypothetical protein
MNREANLRAGKKFSSSKGQLPQRKNRQTPQVAIAQHVEHRQQPSRQILRKWNLGTTSFMSGHPRWRSGSSLGEMDDSMSLSNPPA